MRPALAAASFRCCIGAPDVALYYPCDEGEALHGKRPAAIERRVKEAAREAGRVAR